MDKQTRELSQVQTDVDSVYRIIYSSTPFSTPQIIETPCSVSLAEALSNICPDHYDKLAVSLNSRVLPECDWSYKPKPSDQIAVVIVPEEPVSGTALLTYALVSAAVSVVVGFITYNLFLKPEDPDREDQNRLATIRSPGNRARKYDPYRVVLGKRRIEPDYLAEPYTFNRGDDEWLRALLCVGYGPLDIDDIRIGETPLSDFEHNIAVVDYYNSDDLSPLRTLWPEDVVQDVNAQGIKLEYNDDLNVTTASSPDFIQLDFITPRGLSEAGEKGRALSVSHTYTHPVTNRLISVVKISRIFVSDNDKFRPQPGTLIRMSSGQWRVPVDVRVNRRNPWDRTDGRAPSHPSGRNIRRRSWTFPSNAIVGFSGGLGSAGFGLGSQFAHVDMALLSGQSRTRLDEGGVEQPDGSWTDTSPLAALSEYGSSPRQRRYSLRYSPIPRYSGVDPINTTTRKMYPEETPDDASLIDDIVITNFKTIRRQSQADFESIVGYDRRKPYINGSETQTFFPVVMAVEIKASEQLSGTLRNLNCLATSCVPSNWNADWRDWRGLNLKTTENPAECYRWVLQGPMQDSPLPNSKVNLPNLEDWRDYCNLPAPLQDGSPAYPGPQWRISYEMVKESTLLAELQKIAFTGRAEFSWDDTLGQYGVVVRDRRQFPVQLFTPKNSWGYTASREYPERVDGIRFEFDNEDADYQQDENDFEDPRLTPIQKSGKWQGTTFEGVPNADMAYRMARFNYYTQFLQRERYQISTDIEGLIAKRGSLVRLQHDVIDVGLGSGRVKEIGSGYIVLDETFQLVFEEYFMDSLDITWDNNLITLEGALNADFGLQFRYSDGTIPETAIVGTYVGGGRFNVNNNDITDLEVGDFAIYGDIGREYIDAVVVGIDYGEDLVCQITMTNYDEAVFDIDEDPSEDPIPEFVTQLAERPEYIIPNAPVLSTFDQQAGINISKQQLYLTMEYTPQAESPVESFSFQFRSVSTEEEDFEEELDEAYDTVLGAWSQGGVLPYGETQYVLQGIERGTVYRIRARARGNYDLYSPFSVPVNAEVPLDFPPDSVDESTLSFEHTRQGIILKWGNVIDPDLAYYEVRTNTNVGDENGLIGESAGTRLNVGYNDDDITYYVFARTIYGTYSESGAEITIPTFYVPPSLSPATQLDGLRGTRIRWQPVVSTGDFPADYLDYYEVREDNNPGVGEGLITTLTETALLVDYITLGEEPTYYIFARSVGGFYSPALQITPVAPLVNPVTDLIATPIDNVAVVDWEAPANLIYPIQGYDVEELLPGRVDFVKLGNVSATYLNATEREGGNYTYRVRAVDFAGNKSDWVSVQVRLFDPTDFVLLYSQDVDFTQATVSNGVIDFDESGSRVAYFPLDTSKTVQNYIDEAATESGVGSGVVTSQQKNDNVGEWDVQYTFTGESYFERVFDLFEGQTGSGLVVSNNTIEIAFDWEYIQDNEVVDVSSSIAWSETDTPANYDATEEFGTKTFVTDQFRYVRVRVYFDSTSNPSGLPFVKLNSLEINVDVKQKTDQGKNEVVGQSDPSFPTEIEFNKVRDAETGNLVNRFLDVTSVTATVKVDSLDPGVDPDALTVYTEFEYLEDPNDVNSPVVRDKFKAYVQNTETGAFIDAEISWVARGV